MAESDERDRGLRMADTHYRAMRWATEHFVDVSEQHVHDKVQEAKERYDNLDIIGSAVCMVHATVVMFALDYTHDEIQAQYTLFNKGAERSLLEGGIDDVLDSMDDFFDVDDKVQQRDIEDDPKKQVIVEEQILRRILFEKSDINDRISEFTDKLRDAIDELTSDHDCSDCAKRIKGCDLYESGVYKVIQAADKAVRDRLQINADKVEEVLSKHKVAKLPIRKINKDFPNAEQVGYRFTLLCMTAMMLICTQEMPIDDCKTVSGALRDVKNLGLIAGKTFKQTADEMGIDRETLARIAGKQIGRMLENLSEKDDDDEDDDKDDSDKPSATWGFKPGDVKFGNN